MDVPQWRSGQLSGDDPLPCGSRDLNLGLQNKCLKPLSLAHCFPFFPSSLHSRSQNRNRLWGIVY